MKVSIQGLTAAIMSEVEEITDEAKEIAVEAAKLGEKTTRDIITLRDRIDTGEMINSVDSAIISQSGHHITTRFGLGRGPHWSVPQEGGFTHNWSGNWVRGMFAVTDAADIVYQYLESQMGRL